MKVVIADDHAIFRETLAFLLQSKLPCKSIIEVESVSELKDAVQAQRVDLVLIDFHMPDGSTLAAAEYIKHRYADVKVVFLTGTQAGFTLAQLVDSCVDGVLHKEEGAEDIVSAIKKVMAGERFVSGRVLDKVRGGDFSITKREFDTLSLIVNGLSSKEIAEKLSVSARTIDKHKENIMKKAGVTNVVQLVAFVSMQQLITPDSL